MNYAHQYRHVLTQCELLIERARNWLPHAEDQAEARAYVAMLKSWRAEARMHLDKVKRRMTELEERAVTVLKARVRAKLGSFDSRFIRDLNEHNPITNAQAAQLWRIAWTYRRQIADEKTVLAEAERHAKQREGTDPEGHILTPAKRAKMLDEQARIDVLRAAAAK